MLIFLSPLQRHWPWNNARGKITRRISDMKYIIHPADVSASRAVIGRQKCYGAHGDRIAKISPPPLGQPVQGGPPCFHLPGTSSSCARKYPTGPYRRAMIHHSCAALRRPHTPLLLRRSAMRCILCGPLLHRIQWVSALVTNHKAERPNLLIDKRKSLDPCPTNGVKPVRHHSDFGAISAPPPTTDPYF